MNVDKIINECKYKTGYTHTITKPIEIMRGCMGSGKTYSTLKELDPENQILFVTERLESGIDAQEDCPFLKIVGEGTSKTKGEHIKELLLNGSSCICTHKLFRELDQEVVEIIEEMGVHCCIDELLESCIEIKGVPNDYGDTDAPVLPLSARKFLEATKVIDIDPDSHLVSWDTSKIPAPKGMGVLDDLYGWAKAGVLLWFTPTRDELSGYVVTTFPTAVLAAFKSVKLLCYNFEGLPFHGYLDTLRIPYVFNDRFLDEAKHKAMLREKIDIIEDCSTYKLLEAEGKKINKPTLTLSRTCWDKLIDDKLAAKIGSTVDSYAHNNNIPTKEIAWTCYKSDLPRVAKGFKMKRLNAVGKHNQDTVRKGTICTFVSNTTKGTNYYKDRTFMANLCCLHINPVLKNFFLYQGFIVDEDAYILEATIQWLMRGCARDRDSTKKMKVLIGSKKARELVIAWLHG